VGNSGRVYQAVGPSARTSGETVRVVLVLDMPTDAAELPTRAVELADEFGTMVSHLMPGVTAHKAELRPATPDAAEHDVAEARPGGLIVDVSHRLVTIDGAPVRLTYREFELLRYVNAYAERTISRAELMREVWRDVAPRMAETISERTVDTHVQRLRAKLGDHGRLLVTVRGRGYRFAPAREVRCPSAAVQLAT
jgi:DNA-binding response OmpR family regulator